MKTILLLLITVMCLSCTYRGAYEGMQASKRFECTKLPSTQYEDCMERANKSYDEYERERQETLNQ